MLSILVGHSYFLRLDRKQRERAKPYPPLATLQVVSLLRRAGHAVTLFDAMLAQDVGEFAQALRRVQPQVVVLYEDNFNFLSKMCLGTMRAAACEMIALAHRGGARVIVAGSDVSDTPEPYLRAGADVALLGEGLPALEGLLLRLDLAPHARAGALADGLGGTTYLIEGRLTSSGGARPVPAAQYGEPPAWDLVDVDRYRAVWLRAHGYFSVNMAASRGCSFRCAWCAKPIWGNQYLQREPASVAAEMAHLKHALRADHVWFADDIFGFRVDWISAFTAALQAQAGAIPFTIQTRADLVSERMAVALREAGCREAWIGAESGSQRVLDAMNKGTTVAEIAAARARLKAQGVRVGFFIQLGYLDEQLADILATRELLEATLPDDVGVSVSYPLPGTRFYEQVKAQLGARTHWHESDDLEMMFQGTYSSGFYRAVRDLLHDRISLEQANAPERAVEYRRGARRLERRWRALLSREVQHRSGQRPAVEARA
ncbi:MAG: B12-binding domain-containing radical SAM protein [Proteobacteria bacterium]|nr:B12-binding domain-containing radical SAM protein [Pseudomonadota bacterium]